MLSTWYFCTTLGLSPHHTDLHLHAIRTLHDRTAPAVLRRETMTSLIHADGWRLLHALPAILDLRHAEGEEADPESEDLIQACALEITGRWVAETARHRDLEQVLIALTDGDKPTLVFAQLAEAVADASFGEPAPLRRRTVPAPYTDLQDQALPTLLLVALDALGRREPLAVRNLILQYQEVEDLVERALGNAYGRQALILAADLVSRPGEGTRRAREALVHPDAGLAGLEPDLMAALARAEFGHPGFASLTQVGLLEAETMIASRLPSYRSARREATALAATLFHGEPVPDPAALSLVLWQSTLWSLAAELCPSDTASRLRRWWPAPPDSLVGIQLPAGRRDLSKPAADALRTRIGTLTVLRAAQAGEIVKLPVRFSRNPVAQTDPVTGAYLCSPWLHRGKDGFKPVSVLLDDKLLVASAFDQVTDPLVILRLLSAVDTAATLLQATRANGPEQWELPEHLFALILHARDFFADARCRALLESLRGGRDPGETARPALIHRHLLGGLLFASRLVDRIGKGVFPEIAPEAMARFLERHCEPPATRPTQWQLLFQRVALQHVSTWIEESGSGEPPSGGTGEGSTRWFLGENAPGRRILERTVKATGQSEGALAALRFFFPDSHAAVDGPDWSARLPRKGGPTNWLGARKLINAPAYPVTAWETLYARAEESLAGPPGKRDVEDKRPAAVFTLRSVRISALLADQQAAHDASYEAWVDEWLAWAARSDSPRSLARDVRVVMLGWFALPMVSEAAQRRALRVLGPSVDLLIEFSQGAPRFIYDLLAALTPDDRPDHQPENAPSMRQELRYRLLRDWYQVGSRRQLVAGAEHHPQEILRAERSALGLHNRLRDFMAVTARQPAHTNEELGRAFERLWARTLLSPPSAGVTMPLSEVAGEPWRLAVLFDRYNDQAVVYPMDVDVTLSSQAALDQPAVRSLFDGKSAPSDGSWFLGIVSEAEEGTGSVRLSLNCGLGHALVHRIRNHGTTPRLGALRAVRLTADGAGWVAAETRELARPQPLDGEVRTASVRQLSTFPWLSVLVDGVEVYPGDELDGQAERVSRIRRSWDPDLLRGPSGGTGKPLTTLARWDALDRAWLPADRTMIELLAEGDTEPTVLTCSGPAEGDDRWRFTTRPGVSYVLSAADWHEDSALRIRTALGGGRAEGLRLTARLRDGLLALDGDDPLDDINLGWRERFSPGEIQEAYLADGAWWIRGVSVPGSGAKIAVAELVDAGMSAYFQVAGWSGDDPRRPRVRGERNQTTGIKDWDKKPDLARFEELYDVERDEEVHLERILGNPSQRRSVLGETGEGLIVEVESASLSLRGDALWSNQHLASHRKAVVASVRWTSSEPRPGAEPPSDAEFAAVLGVPVASLAALHGRRLKAVIVRRVTGASHRNPITWTLWIRIGSRVHVADMPAPWFGGSPRLVGDRVLIGRDPSTGLWGASPQQRKIIVQALFTVAEATTAPSDSHFVGIDETGAEIHEAGWGRPRILHRIPRASRHRQNSLPWGRTQASVTLENTSQRAGRRPVKITGTTTKGAPFVYRGALEVQGDLAGVEIAGARLSLDQCFEREFLVTRTLSSRVAAPAPSETDSGYQRFLVRVESGDALEFEGRVVQDGRGFRLGFGYKAPTPTGAVADTVPFAETDTPWIPREYSGTEVRAVLRPKDEGYEAVSRTVQPLDIGALRELVLRTSRNQRGRAHALPALFGYVGRERYLDGYRHRFEWGHGWTVLIPEERVWIGRRDSSGPHLPLFHGDMIRRAWFEEHEDDLHLIIDPTSIELDVPHAILLEAEKKVVHQVDVVVVDENIRVEAVHTGRREVTLGGLPDHVRKRALAATFHRRSQEPLLRVAERRAGRPSATRQHETRFSVLAELDRTEFTRSVGQKVMFHYLTAEEAMAPGRQLFLEAGLMRRTRNDTFLAFRLRNEIDGDTSAVVEVSRRRFSHRQDLLPQVLAAEGDGHFDGRAVMLVQILERGQGSTNWPPPRPDNRLHSLLSSRDGQLCYVAERSGAFFLEIMPGVLFDADVVSLPEGVRAGSAVWLTKRGDRIVGEVAIPSDHDYYSEGRAATLLPLNNARRGHPFARSGGEALFSLGGLPGVTFRIPGARADEVLAIRHPKNVLLDAGLRLAEPGPEGLRAGKISGTYESAVAEINDPWSGAPTGQSVGWSRLSFRDRGAREIGSACGWSTLAFHDKETFHFSPELQTTPVRTVSARNGTVFFGLDALGWTLRHDAADMRRYAFPTAHLLGRLRTDKGPKAEDFTVAAADERGLWLEIRPGHIAEIRGALLTAREGRSLARLWWEEFAPGDRVRLRLSQLTSGVAELPQVELVRWEQGVRGAFASGAAVLLPVLDLDPETGTAVLGVGELRLAHPIAGSEQAGMPIGTLMRLTPQNVLEPAGRPATGDMVAVELGADGELRVAGLPGARVVVAEDGWEHAPWLWERLARSGDREEVLTLLGGGLLLRVERYEGGVLEASWRGRRADTWPRNRIMRATVRGMLAGRMLLTCGGSVLTAAPQDLVHGMPADFAQAAAEHLSGRTIWAHTDAQARPSSGFPPTGTAAAEARFLVEKVLESGEDSGMVVRDLSGQAHRWLPSSKASWAGDLPPELLRAHLEGHRARMAVVGDGSASLIGTRDLRAMLNRMALGDQFMITPLEGPGPGLAKIDRSEVILEFPDAAATGPRTVLAEVSRRRTGTFPQVRFVPAGSRQVIADLPRWMARTMIALSTPSGVPEHGPFPDYARALLGTRSGDGPDHAILVALAVGSGEDEALADWLELHEQGLVQGTGTIDLPPFVAAILLTHGHTAIASRRALGSRSPIGWATTRPGPCTSNRSCATGSMSLRRGRAAGISHG